MLPWASGVVQRYHMCQAWCLALAAAADSKVARMEVSRLAHAILGFATFKLDHHHPAANAVPSSAAAPPDSPARALLMLMARLVNRRGTLSLYDLVAGTWSAEETGSRSLCRWMLTLLPQIMGAPYPYCESVGVSG